MGGIVVVTPTVEARRDVRETTLSQWRAFGLDPLVVEQGPPYGHQRSRETARAALAAGLDAGASLIVFAEDDIDLDARVPRILPLCLGDTPCSLWHRPRFEPAGRAVPGQVVITRAKNVAAWVGSLCVVLSRAQAEKLVTTPPAGGGIDNDMRTLGMRITLPSLVQHRALPRVATKCGPRQIFADDYEGWASPC